MKKSNLKTTVLEKKNKMLNITTNIQGLKELQKHIDFVEGMLKMKTDINFQKYMQNKVLETVRRITDERLIGGTTNDDAISLYRENHKIREEQQGFILYNDTMIPADVNGVQNDIENYPDGMFCVALAFEYGVGIIGENTPSNENAWAYNLQGYNFGWYLPKSVAGESGIQTAGYMGFEIYRYTAEEVKQNLEKWVEEYYRKEVK